MRSRTNGRIRVVLADDHTVVRIGTRQILQQDPEIEVVGEAADGEEAVALVQSKRPHVVLIDVAMPRLNGVEATRRIKEACPEVAVIALTVHDEDEYIFAMLRAGAAGYLLKDVPARRLGEAVRAARAGEAVLDPAIVLKILARFGADGERSTEGHAAPALTRREMEILKLAAAGLGNQGIARELRLSVRTVQAHTGHIFRKLGVASRTEAAMYGLRVGWFRIEDLGLSAP